MLEKSPENGDDGGPLKCIVFAPSNVYPHQMKRMQLRAALPLAVALSFAAGLALAGEPTTPLGKWMKPNMGTPMAGQDFAALQTSLDLVASKPPPSGSYTNWAIIAKAGSAAAAKKDLKALKAACKDCHDQYKENYKKEFAARPFP
jgi:hypothetical protein